MHLPPPPPRPALLPSPPPPARLQVRGDTDKYFVSRVVPFFFVLADLSNVRHTYQFGLKWFLRLFNDALVTCLRSNTGKPRLASLTSHFTAMFYSNVSR